ncbi:MAG: hypothetical protein AB7F89_04505 [Pirellulaceae bacterium]
MADRPSHTPPLFWVLAWTLYGLLVVGLLTGLFAARRRALASAAAPGVQDEWDDWRSAAAEQGREGPVARRVPRSPEPPTVVLLRDHFPVCLGGLIGITSLVYWFVVLMVRGAAWGPRFEVQQDG